MPRAAKKFANRFYGVIQKMMHVGRLGKDTSTTPALILSKDGKPNPVRHGRYSGLSPSERSAMQVREKRAHKYAQAAQVSSAVGYPLTHQLTLTWNALAQGERRDGHSLHLPEPEVVGRLWRNLKHMLRKSGLPFIAMRAPEYDAKRASHLHVAMHLPDDCTTDLIQVIENLTGAPNDTTTIFTTTERNRGYLARSGCRGWLLQENRRLGAGGELGLVGYLTKASKRPEVVSRYRLSGDLSRLIPRDGPNGPP